uniref:Leucine-rich repeat-containing protein 16B-like n=1 Tax=Cyprinodon variegatus TaxID=28743 RepID=A0A3Q2CUN3_CYPVA
MLSKALQINTTLRSVTWDRNNTSATGFLDVARALEHNFTLQYMPLPISDISQAYRSAPEKTEQALTKIQRALVRNNQTQRFSQRQALRLHQGLVTSTAEKVMERLCVRVQQQVCLLRSVGEMEEIQAAKLVLKEARNSRALYPSLCELAHVLSVDGPVRQRLDSLAGELAKAADKELQVIFDSMVSLCRELCPLSSSAAERLSPSLSSVSERVSIPRSAIRTALMERAAQDIHRALEEVKLSVVSYLTNSIVDQILQELYATHKTLTRQVSHLKCWEGTCEDGTAWSFNRHTDSLDITDEELGASIVSVNIVCCCGCMCVFLPFLSFCLCDDSSSSPPPSVPSYCSPLSHSASWEGLSDLPTQGLPLHHVTRVRPRPPRRHRGVHVPSETHCSENGEISPLDDGLPDFYTKRVLPDSQLSSLHKAHSLRRKKRRNMLTIFGFRRTIIRSVCCSYSFRTAMENVYTLLQAPRPAARSSSNGSDGKINDQQGKGALSLPPEPSIPQPGVDGGKHPLYSPREVLQAEADLLVEGRPGDPLPETQCFGDRLQDMNLGDPRTSDGQTDWYWTESRHMERQWTVDRHTQRQIDRKIERQWIGGRQIERSWSENRPMEAQIDNQWMGRRHTGRTVDRQAQNLPLAQKPLPPYPSERTPLPKQERDPSKSTETASIEWHPLDSQGDRGGSTDGWRGSGKAGSGVSASRKPDPPPQSSKPNVSRLRPRQWRENSVTLPGTVIHTDRLLIIQQPKTSSYVSFSKESANDRNLPPHPVLPPANRPIHGLPDRAASQGYEGLRPQAPVKPQRNRKAMSCDAGSERESPNNIEKPQNRKPPVKKPRLPQNRNKSVELSDSLNTASGHSELV